MRQAHTNIAPAQAPRKLTAAQAARERSMSAAQDSKAYEAARYYLDTHNVSVAAAAAKFGVHAESVKIRVARIRPVRAQ